MRVTANRQVCIGAGLCALTAPDVFEQDDNGIVRLLSRDTGPGEEVAREVAVLCPSGAVQIVEE